uniref:Uncharacterized protein n=1 Tax=Chenopodium quinoa TaxID=63459 RepID=A0A803N0Y3_CHEQI
MLNKMVGKISSKPGGKLEMGERRAALPRLGCSDRYARVARSSPESDAPYCPSVVSNEQGRAIGAFPTERHVALPRPGCSDKYVRVARSSPESDAPHCPRVVSNDQGFAVGNRRERGTSARGMKERGRKESGVSYGEISRSGRSDEEKTRKHHVPPRDKMDRRRSSRLGFGVQGVVRWQETSHMTRNGGARNGVGVILDEKLSKEVIEVYRKNDRLIRVKLLSGKEIVNVISAYAP